ncbi:MAG: hypothetical protein ACYC35_25625 [Pirellulales bacterium]
MKKQLLVEGMLVFSVTVVAVVACYAADTETPQAVIAEIGELGENVYDLAKGKEWTKVGAKLTSLTKEAELLRTQVKDADEAKAQLDKSIAALKKSVGAKDQHTTMEQANQVTLIAANLTDPFHPKVPTDVTRLDFYGRELEVWAAAKDEANLTRIADALQKTWKKVRPAVVDRGGKAEAKMFDGLVAKLKLAKSPGEFNDVATPILDGVDNLEKVFAK